MGRTEELSDFERGTFTGRHFCHMSVCEISALLGLPWSTVSAIMVDWKLSYEAADHANSQSGAAGC